MDLSGSGQTHVAGYSEQGNERLVTIKSGEFLEQLAIYSFSNEDFVPWVSQSSCHRLHIFRYIVSVVKYNTNSSILCWTVETCQQSTEFKPTVQSARDKRFYSQKSQNVALRIARSKSWRNQIFDIKKRQKSFKRNSFLSGNVSAPLNSSVELKMN